jgi:hypothetical protein
MKKLLLILLIAFGCKDAKNSKLTGIIGSDDSIPTAKPAYGEYLGLSTEGALRPYCNAVISERGSAYTAAHCLDPLAGGAILLSGKLLVSGVSRIPAFDLASGSVDVAPSKSIRIRKIPLPPSFHMSAVWFDPARGGWRLSSGTGSLNGGFIEHNLDMNPGASGAGLTVDDEYGPELVAIHLGYVKDRNFNIAVRIPTSGQDTVTRYGYQPEFCYYRDGSSAPEEKCYPKATPGEGEGGNNSGDGDDSGHTGPGGISPGQRDPTDPGSEDPGSTTDDESDTPDGSGETPTPDPGSKDSIDIFPKPGTPPAGGQDIGTGGGRVGNPCYDCGFIDQTLQKNDEGLSRDDCERSPAEPFLDKVITPTVKSPPAVTFDPTTPKTFSQSLKNTAERIIKSATWVPSKEIPTLPKEVQMKAQAWLAAVVKNLNDYYALIVSTYGSDAVKTPEAKDFDLTEEGIAKARDYLEAVKKQIEANPDQFQASRRQVVEMAEASFQLADEARREGDRETSEAAMEIGLKLTDAAVSMVPVVSWVKDTVEAATGYNVITGEKLDPFSRSMAVVGMLSAGIGSKLIVAGKVAILVKVTTRIAKAGEEGNEAARIFLKGNELYRAAREAGVVSDTKRRIESVVEAIKFRKPGATAEELEKGVYASLERYKNAKIANGEKPINAIYAGETYYHDLKPALKSKYPEGVRFSEDGFPEFTKYAKDLGDGKKFVKIEPQVSHSLDVKAANDLSGFKTTPPGYTWHHHQEFGRMELVPTDIHREVSHSGGASIWGHKTFPKGS